MNQKKMLLTFVGMPGAGKTKASEYVKNKGIPFIRFGDLTDLGLEEMGLSYSPDNERQFREKIRKELGMAAYAIKAKPMIDTLLQTHNTIGIDGLYSWEEYTFLKEHYPTLTLIHIFAEPNVRYHRLSTRPVRPVPLEKCFERDVTEIENLNKGGPIAIADYLIENDTDLENLRRKIDTLLDNLGVTR